MTRGRSTHVFSPARLPVYSCLRAPTDLLPRHPCSSLSPCRLCSPSSEHTTWGPSLISRQKREPQPPSGCQRSWQEGAPPLDISWETASSPEKGHLEIKFLPLCVVWMYVGAGKGVKKCPSCPLCFSLFRDSLAAVFLFSPSPNSSPSSPACGLCWDWTRGPENVPAD